MRSIRQPVANATLLLALAGCTAQAIDAPSLQPRAIERMPIDPPDATAEPATPVDPALTTKLAALVTKAEQTHGEFEVQRKAAETVAKRGAGASEGSDAWVQAQAAISALEAAQGPTRDISAEIDTLRSDPAYFGTGSRTAIDAAAAKVEALSSAEADAIAALKR